MFAITAFERPDWGQMFVPDASLFESFLRGCAVYVALVILFRVVLKRQSGGVCLTDIMLAVLVSECVSSALSHETKSIPNGLAAVLGLLVCNYLADWAQHRWQWFRKLSEPQPVELIRDGKLIRENMDKEQVSEDELLSKLREQGVDDPARVRLAMMESDGKVSVIEADGRPRPSAAPPPPPAGTPPDFAEAVRLFAAAAERLQAAVAWHEARAAEHLNVVREAKEALARAGVRGVIHPPPRRSRSSSRNGANGHAAAPAGPPAEDRHDGE